jgi:hypothetical protein
MREMLLPSRLFLTSGVGVAVDAAEETFTPSSALYMIAQHRREWSHAAMAAGASQPVPRWTQEPWRISVRIIYMRLRSVLASVDVVPGK